MLWFLMRVIAYGFETIILSIMIFCLIGVIHEKRPEWLEFIFTKLFLIEDDE